METLTETRRMNTFTISVPTGSSSTFLRNLTRNMGWKTTITRPKREPRYPALDRAIEDVKKGNVYYAKDLDDLFAQLDI